VKRGLPKAHAGPGLDPVNVLVTGSSGAIGSAVARRLRREGPVIGLDLRPGAETTRLGDIADSDLLKRLLRGVGAVVHTAALHVPHLGTSSESDFRRTNVEATQTLLECADAAGVSRFVLTSTTSVYGCSDRPGPPATWADEDLSPQPGDVYDRTKLEAERLCRERANGRMSCVVLRMSRCFPEPDHLLAFYRMYRGVDREDVAEAHYRSIVAPIAGSATVNISAPSPFRREDVAELWDDPWRVIERRAPGVRAAFEHRGWPLPPRIDRVYPIAAAAERLGYRPRQDVRTLLGLEYR
jgi:nucleoside-diphosphate-sugar epimerase